MIQTESKSKEEIIKARYPFYDENLSIKDVELNGEQVQTLMEEYANQFKQPVPVQEGKSKEVAAIDEFPIYPIFADVLKNITWEGFINNLRLAFIDGAEWQHKTQSPVLVSVGDELVYWRQRCLAAELFIKESPCDPDCTNKQIDAHNKWQELNKNIPDFVQTEQQVENNK